jgi:DNA-binding NarL/FixJ family response regulator
MPPSTMNRSTAQERTAPAEPEVRVFLIDDHHLLRGGLRSLITRMPGWSVVGESDNGTEGVHQALCSRPNVVVTDMMMEGANGIQVAGRLRAAGYEGGILLLTAHSGDDLARDARNAGVSRLLPKTSSFEVILAAIQEAALAPLPGSASPAPAASSQLNLLASLTARERDVLRFIAGGMASKEIAEKLGCSSKTVDVHRHNLLAKLGATGPAELTRIAIRGGIIGL